MRVSMLAAGKFTACAIVLGGGLFLAACATPAGDAPQNVMIGNVPAVAAYSEYRFITARPSPADPTRTILCTEPSPDIAKALQTALALSANAQTHGVTASGSVNYTAAETITAMAGRTAAVVALRDGLYKACEAYANGAIGDTAYGLILARYGDLLTTLMLGEAAATAPSGSGSSSTNSATSAQAIQAIHRDYYGSMPEAMLQAILVSCLTTFDPSRPGAASPNPVLTPAMCRGFVSKLIATTPRAFAAGKAIK
ncbi:MAG TPA: hypothetical protein VMV19_18750 [Xanthobacteraceae bacterium]|nr:hypothetical protein [Xanthobacteraceae bacterium]